MRALLWLRTQVALALLLPSFPAAAAAGDDLSASPAFLESLELPSLRWTRGHKVLRLELRPAVGTELPTGSEIVVLLDDQHALRLRWKEPITAPPKPHKGGRNPGLAPFRLRLPGAAVPESQGWRLRVTGTVCSRTEDGPCLVFRASGEVPKRGKGQRLLESIVLGTTPRPNSTEEP